MKERIRIVGGPRDGGLVPHRGPVFREPVFAPKVQIYDRNAEIPIEVPMPKLREYSLERRPDGSVCYVLTTTDLGQPGFRPSHRA